MFNLFQMSLSWIISQTRQAQAATRGAVQGHSIAAAHAGTVHMSEVGEALKTAAEQAEAALSTVTAKKMPKAAAPQAAAPQAAPPPAPPPQQAMAAASQAAAPLQPPLTIKPPPPAQPTSKFPPPDVQQMFTSRPGRPVPHPGPPPGPPEVTPFVRPLPAVRPVQANPQDPPGMVPQPPSHPPPGWMPYGYSHHPPQPAYPPANASGYSHEPTQPAYPPPNASRQPMPPAAPPLAAATPARFPPRQTVGTAAKRGSSMKPISCYADQINILQRGLELAAAPYSGIFSRREIKFRAVAFGIKNIYIDVHRHNCDHGANIF